MKYPGSMPLENLAYRFIRTRKERFFRADFHNIWSPCYYESTGLCGKSLGLGPNSANTSKCAKWIVCDPIYTLTWFRRRYAVVGIGLMRLMISRKARSLNWNFFRVNYLPQNRSSKKIVFYEILLIGLEILYGYRGAIWNWPQMHALTPSEILQLHSVKSPLHFGPVLFWF